MCGTIKTALDSIALVEMRKRMSPEQLVIMLHYKSPLFERGLFY